MLFLKRAEQRDGESCVCGVRRWLATVNTVIRVCLLGRWHLSKNWRRWGSWPGRSLGKCFPWKSSIRYKGPKEWASWPMWGTARSRRGQSRGEREEVRAKEMETRSYETLHKGIWLQAGGKQNHWMVLSEDLHDLTYCFKGSLLLLWLQRTRLEARFLL